MILWCVINLALMSERISRRNLIKALPVISVSVGSLFLLGCEADRRAKQQRTWELMLAEQGKQVEADMSKVGLTGYNSLFPFDGLSEDARKRLGFSLPDSGFLFIKKNDNNPNVLFLWQTNNGSPDVIPVSLPLNKIKVKIAETEEESPKVKLTFDLAKFISYNLVPDRYDSRYKRGAFTIRKYHKAVDYLSTPNALKEVAIEGNRSVLRPILETTSVKAQ